MQLYIRFSDLAQLIRPEGPVTAYVVPWAIVLIGHQFALCTLIQTEPSAFYWVVIFNILTALILGLLFQVLSPLNLAERRKKLVPVDFPKWTQRFIGLLLVVYLAGEVLQIIYGGGFPLYWLVRGDEKTYFDYGVPSLNGLLNAVYLFVTTAIFMKLFIRPAWYYKVIIACLLLIPVALVCRQLIMSIFLQMICVGLLFRPKAIFKLLISGTLVIWLFVFIGSMRTGLHSLLLVFPPAAHFPEFLLPLMWVYAYIVTPFNNLHCYADLIDPYYAPVLEFLGPLPTVIRSSAGQAFDVYNFDTGFRTFHAGQVNTFYFEPILDFGLAYAAIFMAIFQLCLLFRYRRALQTYSPFDILSYSVLFQIMVLSIFNNNLLYQPVVFQLILIWLMRMVGRAGQTCIRPKGMGAMKRFELVIDKSNSEVMATS